RTRPLAGSSWRAARAVNSPTAAAKAPAADKPSRLLRLNLRSGACRCAKKSWGDSKRLVLSRRSPEISGKTASGAQGERQLTVPLHDNLDPLHYKPMSEPQARWPGWKDPRPSLSSQVNGTRSGT